jgi:hypothetical protein
MPTVVPKNVGTGGDYTSWTTWEAAKPANLVTVDQIWEGRGANQAFNEVVTIAGSTTDATRFARMTTQTGASYLDDAGLQTNAYRFDSTKGCSISNNTAYGIVINIGENFQMSKLQVAGTGTTTSAITMTGSFACDIDQCIVEHARTIAVVALSGSTAQIRNSLVVQRGTGAASILKLASGASCYGNTLAVGTGITHPTNILEGLYGTPVVKNTAMMGNGATLKTGGNTPTYTTCVTDAASPPSGVTGITYSTANFANITDSARDFKLVSGSALIDVGTTDSTNSGVSGNGVTRSAGTYDIGSWEYQSSGSPGSASGATGTITVSGIAGAGTGAASAAGAVRSVAVSGIAGNATGAAAAAGAIGSVAVSGIAGSATGAGAVAGATNVETVTGIAGAATGAAAVLGALATITLSTLPGDASVGSGTAGAVGTISVSGIAGTATGAAVVPGALATITLARLAGHATGDPVNTIIDDPFYHAIAAGRRFEAAATGRHFIATAAGRRFQ